MNKISIKPEREYLREIVTKIESGEYAIPAFQRDFVWKKTQILELFDSISKGYPIGSIILWKPKNGEVPPVKNIITEEVSEDDRAEYFLLDGRQRATAFMGCVSDWENKSPFFSCTTTLHLSVLLFRAEDAVKVPCFWCRRFLIRSRC